MPNRRTWSLPDRSWTEKGRRPAGWQVHRRLGVPSGPDLLPNVCPRGGGDAAAAHAEMAPDEQVPAVRLRRNRGRARYRPPPPRPPRLVAAASRLGEGWAGKPGSTLEHLQRLRPRKDVVRCPVGQLREEHGLEVSRVLVFPSSGMLSYA